MLFILRRHRRRLALHRLCRRDSISRCHYYHQALTYHYGASDHPLDQTDTPRTCRRKNQSSFDCFIKIKADAAKRVGCFHGDDLFALFIRCRRCRKARRSSRRKRSSTPLSTAPGSIMVDLTQHCQQSVADRRRQSCSARQPQIICDERRIDADLVSSNEHQRSHGGILVLAQAVDESGEACANSRRRTFTLGHGRGERCARSRASSA